VKKEEEEENGYDAYEDDFEVHVILLQFDFFFYPRRYATGVKLNMFSVRNHFLKLLAYLASNY
jgi:hypothetical protein